MKICKNNLFQYYFVIGVVVIVLIALGVWSVVNLGYKAKDAERISDMNVLKIAMSIIHKETGDYLSSSCTNGLVSDCSKVVNKLVEELPVLEDFHDPDYRKGDLPCSAECSAEVCDYAFVDVSEDDYKVYFKLRKGVLDYEVGCYQLTSQGIAKINK